MKKAFIPKFVKAIMAAFFILICGMLFAQGGDTTAVTDTSLTLGEKLLIGAGILLPAGQALLKVIPTKKPTTIGTIIDLLLNLVTFFIANKKKGGGVHQQ